jgi:dolichol-phosphate mannosyltransferase
VADSRSFNLTVALPAYREADSLRELLPVLRRETSAVDASVEIIVIDAATAIDDTDAVCRENEVRHVRRQGGERYGDAIRTAIAEANGTWLLIMDADGSHPPSVVPALWSRRDDGEVVIGSRYVAGGGTDNSALLVAMSLALNFAFRVAFSLKCRDVTNSLRLYRLDVLRALTLESNNFDILQEILIRLAAKRPPSVIVEVPITFLPRAAGESKRRLIPFLVAYARTMVRLWRFRRAAS